MEKTIVLAPEPVSKVEKNRRYEGGAERRKKEREREIVILAVVLAFLLVGDENSPRNLSHDPGASWDHRVEELRAKMKGKETEDKDYLSFSRSRSGCSARLLRRCFSRFFANVEHRVRSSST